MGKSGGSSATVASELGCTLVSQSPPSCFGGTPHRCYLNKDVQLDTTLVDMPIYAHHAMLDKLVMPWLCNIAPNHQTSAPRATNNPPQQPGVRVLPPQTAILTVSDDVIVRNDVLLRTRGKALRSKRC
jgi:hypothetical protein